MRRLISQVFPLGSAAATGGGGGGGEEYVLPALLQEIVDVDAIDNEAEGFLYSGGASGGTILSLVGDDHLQDGINANKIADGSISNSEFQYLNNVSSNIQTQIDAAKKRPLLLTFLLGETPAGTGDHDAVIDIPHSPVDGTTSMTFNVRRLQCWVQTPSAGTTTFQVKRSTGTGAFSGSNMMSSGLSITGGTTYQAHTETFSTTQVSSGDRLRLNFSALDGTHAKFTVTLLLEETS